MKNILSLFSGDVGSRALGFLITVYLARVLEASSFGLINIGLSVLGYLLLLANPGIQLLETRNTAALHEPHGTRAGTVLSLRLTLAIILLLLTLTGSVVVTLSASAKEVIFLFGVSLIPLSAFLDWFFIGKEQFGTVSIARLLNYTAYGLLVFVLVRSATDVMWVPIAFAAGNIAATSYLLVAYRLRFGRLNIEWQPASWKPVLVAGVPVGLAMFLAQSAMNLPPLAIGWLVSTADAGVFSAALKVIFVMLMVDRLLNALLLPVVTRYFATKKEEVPVLLAVVIKVLLVTLLPVTAVCMVTAPLIIPLVFGAGYAGAILILRILLGYFFLTVLNSVFVCTLVGSGHEREYTRALNIGSVIFVAGIVAGAALIGSEGAAYGIVLGELCTVILMIHSAKSVVRIVLVKALIRPLLAFCAMIASILLMQSEAVLVRVTVAVLVFAGAVFLTKGIGPGEIRFLRERFV